MEDKKGRFRRSQIYQIYKKLESTIAVGIELKNFFVDYYLANID